MKILVTGSAGFAGRHLTRHLRERGDDVHSFDLGYPRVQNDIRSYDTIRRIIDVINPDRIYHLAALSYVPENTYDPQRAVETTIGGTANLLEAIRRTGSHARVLIAGTVEEYGYHHDGHTTETDPCNPTTVYGATKHAASILGQVYTDTYGIPVVVTRAVNHTGPGHPARYAVPSFARRIVEVERGQAKTVRHGDLSATRAYLDVRDVVRAYTLAIEAEPGVYNLGTGDVGVTAGEILDMLCRRSEHRPIPIEHDPRLTRPGRPGYPIFSADKLHAATGWEPEYDLERTLADVLDHYREQR